MILGKWTYVAIRRISDLINVFEANANNILWASFVILLSRLFLQEV